jgi:triacylglycerol lipase
MHSRKGASLGRSLVVLLAGAGCAVIGGSLMGCDDGEPASAGIDAHVAIDASTAIDARAEPPASDGGARGIDAPAAPEDGGATPPVTMRPVLLVHGINGSADDYATVIERLERDGWPSDWILARTFEDPAWGCNVDNAATIRGWVEELSSRTGQARVDIVAHSMGTLSSRFYLRSLGGLEHVSTYVTLGGMHHGLSSSCLSPIRPCVWDELCESGDFVARLNDPPVTPEPLWWVSIAGADDEDVPASSSFLEGAENITIAGVDHEGLLESETVYAEIVRVLRYPTR